ncbi:hypothetical protein AGMMS5026_02970 [Endomicrobiia bacterium]|uniref:hypothetical protein n=1 Tax=Endomicrobium trichonymphae TaxID=1408204 RepID=UPI00221B5FC6|nr:hypothetical protein AGMMS49523_06690 [Endomicrobiia bacterium]GMO53369.1 MAG: hypothetical protein Ta2C_04810 [Candidatus Endomicrobium trichonymphae]GHT09642.1 hypothetical protein AGMMS49532_08190 [Endomicrobiia bacterium]GHT13433.1 hypothetical protein AGMMS49571_07150 [Endomicrobiia bacterium]GHT20845.1 hypothetical protein AGMMS49929_08520 [Endomicrobiia bacterium]
MALIDYNQYIVDAGIVENKQKTLELIKTQKEEIQRMNNVIPQIKMRIKEYEANRKTIQVYLK